MAKRKLSGSWHPHRRKGLGHFEKCAKARKCHYCGRREHGPYVGKYSLCREHAHMGRDIHALMQREKPKPRPTRRRPKQDG